MPVATRERTLRSMRKTPVMLKHTLHGVTQAQARAATDGPDGWNVVEIMCHLLDFERVYFERAQSALASDRPVFPAVNHLTLVTDNNYAGQDLWAAFDAWLAVRRQFTALVEGLTDAQGARAGIHPDGSESTVFEMAVNAALHDVNHIEQMIRALGLGEALVD